MSIYSEKVTIKVEEGDGYVTKTVSLYDASIHYLNWHKRHGLAHLTKLGTGTAIHISGAFGTLCNEQRYDLSYTSASRPTCQRCIRKAASY